MRVRCRGERPRHRVTGRSRRVVGGGGRGDDAAMRREIEIEDGHGRAVSCAG
ncbi:hypothetical protein SSAG_05809 [Streptomyces sp. Mg1]|nr:hypothetical protein SSAG_05809 [Streptomyces sp. Mg1]